MLTHLHDVQSIKVERWSFGDFVTTSLVITGGRDGGHLPYVMVISCFAAEGIAIDDDGAVVQARTSVSVEVA
jgi:hypothetical protein